MCASLMGLEFDENIVLRHLRRTREGEREPGEMVIAMICYL